MSGAWQPSMRTWIDPGRVRLDPMHMRFHLKGKVQEIPANTTGTGVALDFQNMEMSTHWKIYLSVQVPVNVTIPANQSPRLEITVTARMENEIIPRTLSLTVGQAQTLYVMGRSLEIQVDNNEAFNLNVGYVLSEGTAGTSAWEKAQYITTDGVETTLNLPTYVRNIAFQTDTTGVILRGYDSAGTLIYNETFTPVHADIPVIPGLAYTAELPAGSSGAAFMFTCGG